MKVAFSVSIMEEDARKIVDIAREMRVSRSLVASAIVRVGLRHRAEVRAEIRRLMA